MLYLEIMRPQFGSLMMIPVATLVYEFHTKANALNGDAMKVLEEAVERLEKDDYQGVVYNEAMNFSAGDLNMIALADKEDWTGIDKYLSHFQSVCEK